MFQFLLIHRVDANTLFACVFARTDILLASQPVADDGRDLIVLSGTARLTNAFKQLQFG